MLLGNRTVFHKLPVRFLAGSTTSFHSQSRSGFGQAGMRRNRFYQDGVTVALKTYSYPQGTYAPAGSQNVGTAYILPQRSGSMASFNDATLLIAPTGLARGGITTTGTATIVIDFATATGGLIAGGNGSASMSFTFANALLTASLNGIGSASFTITPNTPQLGAKASGTGSALLSFSATLTPYATGNMTGTTDVISNVVNANIVSVNGYAVTGNGQSGTEWGPV
jgi:hypothetical protein